MEKNNLTDYSVDKTIIKLTIPMIFGMLSLVIFNLTDTYFIGKLGMDQLAAISFTFPIVLIINSVALGMGIGTASIVSRAAGSGNHELLVKTSTDGLFLSFCFVVIVTILGLNTIDQIFTLLGAGNDVLGYIREYMSIWYLGMPFVVIPMVGNYIIRSLGDTKTPSLIMAVAAIINVILDPLFIFGIGPFPEMGLKGAAIATVFSRMTTFSVALYVLLIRDKVVKFRIRELRDAYESWKLILYVGVPAAVVRIITPVSAGIITRIISEYGYEAVAGYGVATKIEYFLLAFVNAMSNVMVPFAGQNYGAKKGYRIIEGMNYVRKTMFKYGIFIFILMIFLADKIAPLFNDNIEVNKITILYLTILPIGYGFQGMLLNNASILNAVNKPFYAALFSSVQMFVICVPLAVVMSRYIGIKGIFIALLISYIISGSFSYKFTKKTIRKERNK
jgi:putative MATE family efflux protein